VTSSLPQEVRDVFERFVTCEYTTIDSRGQPIVWPVTPYYRQGGPTIDITTGLGYPKKAEDARRNPSVALLFSDPTGSGIDSGIRVLVQGTAEVDDRDLEANRERYWRESAVKLPATVDMHPPAFIRGVFSWYYTRIYVNVRPERVFVWPNGDPSTEPQVLDAHMEEVRSGHAEEPSRTRPAPEGGTATWDERIEELGRRYDTAVLGWLAPDGFPLAVRVPVELDRERKRVAIGAVPASFPLAEGRVCLTAHSHNPDFTWQQNFQIRGDLIRGDDGWAVIPQRMVAGFELPKGAVARYRANARKMMRFHRTARRELKRRRG
jgi:hypothetical protein